MRFTSMDTYAGQEVCPRCGEDEAGDSWPSCADGHPHSETCAKKNYREYVCDRCEFELNDRSHASEFVCRGPEHNTQLPTSVELCGKSKWEVERHPVNAGSAEHVWCAFHNEENIEETCRHFPTWREALAYADQQARTVEVTLPRVAEHPSFGYLVDPDDPWVYSWPDGRWHLAPIGDWDGPAALLCNDVGEYKIHADELRPLALALLALHYQQEVG